MNSRVNGSKRVPVNRHRWNNGDTCADCGLHREGAGGGPYGSMRYYHDGDRERLYNPGPCVESEQKAMNAFQRAVEKARAEGHQMEHDPPHSLSSMGRYTCSTCGRAVVGNGGHAYGSATDGPCPGPPKKDGAP